ncbi:MAG: phosphoenolpyruvate--protein phosphotransferase [Alphaproteobacteria bacterium]
MRRRGAAAGQRPRRGARRRVERTFEGLAVSAGVAIGSAYVLEGGTLEVPEYRLEVGQVEPERARFAAAVARSRKQVEKIKGKTKVLPAAAAEEIGYLLDAHLHMLRDSRLVRGVDKRIARDALNAEAAVQSEIAEITRGFEAMHDRYLAARAQDVREVAERLVRNLTATPYHALSSLDPGSIVVAEKLSPADTALMDPSRIAGFAAHLGGQEGHTAIMARSLGLPAVLGVEGLAAGVQPGDQVIVDGSAGQVIVNPLPETLRAYERRRAEFGDERRQLTRFKNLPAVTRDGVEIMLQANVELPREVDAVLAAGAGGIGLLRSEFLFMNRDSLPSEDEQYRAFRDIVVAMSGRPVTVRTLDVGGDKVAPPIETRASESVNPALGLRAIRLSLRERALLDPQIAAILRAGAHGPVRVLLPMISTLAEVRQVRDAMKRIAARLVRRRIKIADPLPPLGVMIEVPGAALLADALAHACDFFAIGTNDLTMYTLAIDRADEQVAYLYNPLHPAVLRLIQFATDAALRARLPVSLCGEMAGDPRYSALLLGLGIRDLSMTASSLPRVTQRVRGIDSLAATQRAHLILEQWDTGRITALLDDFNALA